MKSEPLANWDSPLLARLEVIAEAARQLLEAKEEYHRTAMARDEAVHRTDQAYEVVRAAKKAFDETMSRFGL